MNLSADSVCRGLQHLNRNTYPSQNMGHSATLREGASILETAPSTMFSHSLSRVSLPENWKPPQTTPIFKGGRHSEPSRYRLVTPLSISSKIMNFLICDGMHDHLPSVTFSPLQMLGFRNSHSCIIRLLTSVDR